MIINGNVLKEMPKLEDFSFDTLISAVLYNLGSEIYIDKIDGKNLSYVFSLIKKKDFGVIK